MARGQKEKKGHPQLMQSHIAWFITAWYHASFSSELRPGDSMHPWVE